VGQLYCMVCHLLLDVYDTRLILNIIYVWKLNQTVLESILELSNFCSSLDGIWTHTIDTLQHHSLSLTSSALYHSTTSTPYIIYICIPAYHISTYKQLGLIFRLMDHSRFVCLPIKLTRFCWNSWKWCWTPIINCSLSSNRLHVHECWNVWLLLNSKRAIVIKRQVDNLATIWWVEHATYRWYVNYVCFVLDYRAEFDF
jgi:hypothetical protein